MPFPKEAFLTHNWKLDEASGTRADTVGGMTLTDNNTVGSSPGHVYSLAGKFVSANVEYLSHVDDASLRMVGSTSFETWIQFGTGFPANTRFFAKDSGVSEFTAGYYSAWGIFFYYWDSVGTAYYASTGVIVPVVDAWYHIIATYSAADKKARIYVNDGAEHVSAASPNTNRQSSCPFWIGHGGASAWQGSIGPLRVWNTLLDAADRSALYNGGAGLVYPSAATNLSIYPPKMGINLKSHGGGNRYGDA